MQHKKEKKNEFKFDGGVLGLNHLDEKEKASK